MFSKSTRRWALTLLPLGFGLAACSDEVAEPLPPSLVQFAEAPTSECEAGGRLVISGIDLDRNGTLEGDEVASTIAVCNGETGEQGIPGTNALIRSTDEPAGDNCDVGGVRIDVGADDDDDGTLDEGEVDQTTYACDGPQGQTGLRTLTESEPVGPPLCEDVGVRIVYGLDQDDDGELDEGEITSTEVLCRGGAGEETLVEFDPEPAGANCVVGGVRVSSGVDLNGDRVLDEAEVTEIAFVCDPVRSLVRTRTSTSCANGGSRIEVGPDLDGDGELADTEVNEITNVCAGEDAGRSLVVTIPEPAGANCAAGGQLVEIGFDDNEDGVLQAGEVETSKYVCNGERGDDGTGGNAVRVTTEPVGSTDCPNGGTRIETGPDTNGNGNLDDAEVTNTAFSCNGDTTTTLVDVVNLAGDPNGPCGSEGGQRIWTGVDDDGDGVLDASERDASQDVCDTTTGTGVPFAILTESLPDSFRTLTYDEEIEAFGGTAGGYSWTVVGLPPDVGLTIDPSGTPSTSLSGTITATGSYAFTVRVEDTFGQFAERQYTINIQEPPCAPGTDGIIGDTLTEYSLPSVLGTGYGIAADTSTSGWVYITGTTELVRFTKDGQSSEDLEALSSLSSVELGYDILIDGDDIYVLDNSSSSTSNRMQRISDDGGQTFTYQDMVTFSTAPDDMRGMAIDGTTAYLITQGSSDTEIYSADISGTLPAPATLEATITTVDGCAGLDLDDDYFYTGCTDPADAVVRIDRSSFTVDTLTTNIDASTTYNSPKVQDTDGDGLADVLWFQGFTELRYLCSPTGTVPVFSGEIGASEAADYGLGIDRVNGVLWRYDDSPDELFQYQ